MPNFSVLPTKESGSIFAQPAMGFCYQMQENIDKAPDRMSYGDYDNQQLGSYYGCNKSSGLMDFIVNSLFPF